jgi:hypothetical protein
MNNQLDCKARSKIQLTKIKKVDILAIFHNKRGICPFCEPQLLDNLYLFIIDQKKEQQAQQRTGVILGFH